MHIDARCDSVLGYRRLRRKRCCSGAAEEAALWTLADGSLCVGVGCTAHRPLTQESRGPDGDVRRDGRGVGHGRGRGRGQLHLVAATEGAGPGAWPPACAVLLPHAALLSAQVA